ARQGDCLTFAVMGIVAVEAGHSSAVQAMGVGLVLEGRRLVDVTRCAELSGHFGDQMLVLGKRMVNGVAAQTVHRRRIPVEAERERGMLVGFLMAGETLLRT